MRRAQQRTVHTLRGEIYVLKESLLAILDAHKIPYEKVPLPVGADLPPY
jgi:hypothetical protein